MAKVGAQRAAELTGKSKSTIQRAMNSGKLSYEMDNNDRRVIDVSELERVFGLKSQTEGKATSSASVEAELQKAADMLEMERMKMRIKMLETQLESSQTIVEDMKAQRDQWQKQAQQVLITSQYSQKQADEYKTELKEREERSRKRREQMVAEKMAKKMESMKQSSQNQNNAAQAKQQQNAPMTKNNTQNSTASKGKPADTKAEGFQSLWAKIRGDKAA